MKGRKEHKHGNRHQLTAGRTPHSPYCLETVHTEPGMKKGCHRSLFQKAGWQGSSPNKSHSLLLILPQVQPKRKPSSQGMERVREGGTPLLSLCTDTHAHLSAASHRTFPITLFKKKKREKNPPPHSGQPSHKNGENGVQHIRFRKKPGTEKEAGLVLSILVRLPVASAAAIHRS